MKVVETRVTTSTVQMWLANDSELRSATAWMEVELPLNDLPLSTRRSLRLGVLRMIRSAVEAELIRLAKPGPRSLPAKTLER